MADIRRKLVIVGDGACGKVRLFAHMERFWTADPLTDRFCLQTCLLIVFSKGTFPEVRYRSFF